MDIPTPAITGQNGFWWSNSVDGYSISPHLKYCKVFSPRPNFIIRNMVTAFCHSRILSSAFFHPPFIIHILSSAFYHPHFTIRILPSAFYHPHFTIRILSSTIRHPPSGIRRHLVPTLQRSIILRGTFRPISQLWDNAHTLNLGNWLLYLSSIISQLLDVSHWIVFDFILYCVTMNTL